MSAIPYEDDAFEETGVAVVGATVIDASPVDLSAMTPQEREDHVRRGIEDRARGYKAAVVAFVVTAANLAQAHAYLKTIRADKLAWKALWTPHLAGAQEAKRVAEANRKRFEADIDRWDKPLGEDEQVLAGKILAVEDEIKRLTAAEEARLQLVANADHDERVLTEAVSLYEEAAATTVPEVREALIAEAEEMVANPEPAPVVKVETAIPTRTGISRPKRYKAELTSLNDLLKAMMDKKLDAPLTLDLTKRIAEAVMPALNPRAATLKTAMAIPGVRAVEIKGLRIK